MKNLIIVFVLALSSNITFSSDSPNIYYGKLLDQEQITEYEQNKQNDTQNLFKYTRLMLARITNDCISGKCVQGQDLDLLEKVLKISQDLKTTGILFFADTKGNFYPQLTSEQKKYLQGFNFPLNEQLFLTDDSALPRAAISSVGPGPIIINLDQTKNIGLIKAFEIMLHEFGHQAGARDDEHRTLDSFAAKVSPFIQNRTESVTYKNLNIYNHFYLLATASPEGLGELDLDKYFYPHLLLQDGKYLINLSTTIDKVLGRFLNLTQITSVWLSNIRIIEDKNLIIIRATLGQCMTDPKKPGPNYTIDGEVEIAIPTQIIQDKIIIDINKNIRANYTQLKNFNRANGLVTIDHFQIPKEVDSNNILEFSFEIKVPADKTIKKVHVNSNISSDLSPQVLNPIYRINDAESVIKNAQGIYLASFKIKMKDFKALNYEIKNVSVTLNEEIDDFLVQPMFLQKVKIINGQVTTPFIMQDFAIYSSSIVMSFPPIPNLKIHNNTEFIPLDFFPKNGRNGTHLELYLKDMKGKLYSESNIFIEELVHPPLDFTQKIYKLVKLLTEHSKEVKEDITTLKFTIDPLRLTPGIYGFRFLGIQLFTDQGEGGTLLFIK
jgi:hypothetical protein